MTGRRRARRSAAAAVAARVGAAPAAAVALLSLLALPGCMTVGPDFSPLDPDPADGWAGLVSEGLEPAAPAPERWWELFGDPTLNALVERARSRNVSLEIATLSVLEARAQLAIAEGWRYPQGQAAFGSATFLSPSESDILELLDVDDFWRYTLGATVSWEADFWGRYRRGIEAADAMLQASVAAYDQAIVLVTAQVASTYAAIRATEEQLRISRQNVTLQQRSYDLTEVLYRNGESSELDMQQARTLLLSTQATIPSLEASLRQARNALSLLLGEPPGGVEAVLAGGSGLPVVPDRLGVGLPADMLRGRPDVRQAELLAMAQNAAVGLATADLYPSFQLTGTLSANAGGPGGSSFDEIFDAGALALNAGGGFVWPFLNYGRIRSNIRVQDARLQQALLGYRDTVLRAAREAEDAIAGFVGARAQAVILAETVDAAQRSNDLSVLRFSEGFSGYQRVLDSQQQLFQQQQRYVSIRADAVLAAVGLYKALGGGWQDRSGAPALDAETIEAMRNRTDWGELLDAADE